jgi:hypothetical protein
VEVNMRLFTVYATGVEGLTKRRFRSKSDAATYARRHLEAGLPKDVGDVLRKIPSDDGFLEVFRKVRACRDDIRVDARVQ